MLSHWKKLKACQTPRAAFKQLSTHQILCAVRKGPLGVWALNDLAKKMVGETAIHYAGLPIMITKNDSQLKLYNGDVGIILPDEKGGGEGLV